MFLVAVIFGLIVFLFFVGLIRAILSVDKRVTLLKNIHKELEKLNAKTPDRPSPKELSKMSVLNPPKQSAKTEMATHVLEQVLERKTTSDDSASDVICTNCNAKIPPGDQPHLFAGKVVCKKCDRKLRKRAGLDDSVTTTK